MSNVLALTVGGLIPAICYGTAGVLQKFAARAGISPASYLIFFGIATTIAGIVWHLGWSKPLGPAVAWAWSMAAGCVFALGAGAISLALIRFDASISQLAPLYNTNLLITMALGLVLFLEYEKLHVPSLVIGALLIAAGAILVARA
jgi:drug/metabolite transporter (DMT)-like permease